LAASLGVAKKVATGANNTLVFGLERDLPGTKKTPQEF
jgi:hypothetical protein